MPFAKQSGTNSQISSKLREKRKKIIEEERIRILGDALMLFYDKLMEKYALIEKRDIEMDSEEGVDTEENVYVSREEVEEFGRSYSATKPTGY